MEWAYTTAIPWHARNSTAAAPATKRLADVENRNMVRILDARTLECKRCAAAGLIWINRQEFPGSAQRPSLAFSAVPTPEGVSSTVTPAASSAERLEA